MRKSYRILTALAIAIIPIVFLSSCCSCKNAPKDLRIDVGSGGGFTGMWNGYTLAEGGKVYHWNGKIQGENPEKYSEISNDVINAIWDEVKAAKAFEIRMQQPANLSKYIKISTGNNHNILIWDYSRNDSLTENLNKLYGYLYSILEKKE